MATSARRKAMLNAPINVALAVATNRAAPAKVVIDIMVVLKSAKSAAETSWPPAKIRDSPVISLWLPPSKETPEYIAAIVSNAINK